MAQITDALDAMEERKKSAGLYETDGIVQDEMQIRSLWIGLDLPLEDMEEAALFLTPLLVAAAARAMYMGVEPTSIFRTIWADAFATGVLFERMRNGEG